MAPSPWSGFATTRGVVKGSNPLAIYKTKRVESTVIISKKN